MTLATLAVVLLLAGIALGVIAAFFGVERRRGGQIRRPHPALNLPAIASALTAWGLVGYGLARSGAAAEWVLLGATIAAGIGWVVTGALLAKWALRAPLEDPHDMAEMLQGHVALVTASIGDTAGTITYQLHGKTHVVRAQSLDGKPIREGTEVVIERIDDDVAFVEPWSLVEKRL